MPSNSTLMHSGYLWNRATTFMKQTPKKFTQLGHFHKQCNHKLSISHRRQQMIGKGIEQLHNNSSVQETSLITSNKEYK